MSLLVVLLPVRDRTAPGALAREGGEVRYLLSPDGLAISSHGRATPAQLPRADTTVAVLADADVGWQQPTLPRAPAARLRAALAGTLEDALLDDPQQLHFALAPGAVAGQPAWVAVVHKAWLASQIEVLESAGIVLARVVPSSWPDQPARGHFEADDDAAAPLHLTLAHPQGVARLGLQGTLARALLASLAGDDGAEVPVQWSASPAAAAPAERWLGAPVVVLSDEQRALQATRSLWNLRQFDLAPRHRGTRALRGAWWTFWSRDWRPARIGLMALLVLQLAGINLWAAQLRADVASRKQAMDQLLRDTHPQVRSILDAPAQMRRETDVLRAAAGRAGEADLESALAAAAAAWPDGQPAAQQLRYDGSRLTLTAPGWAAAQREQFVQQLRAAGWQVELPDAQSLALRRAP